MNLDKEVDQILNLLELTYHKEKDEHELASILMGGGGYNFRK